MPGGNRYSRSISPTHFIAMTPDATHPTAPSTTSITAIAEDLQLMRAFSEWGPEPKIQLKEHLAHIETTGYVSLAALTWMLTVDPAAGLGAPRGELDAERRQRVVARLRTLAMRLGGMSAQRVENTREDQPGTSRRTESERVREAGGGVTTTRAEIPEFLQRPVVKSSGDRSRMTR